ncbi:MAG TPA: hypothetical protein VMF61_11190 [Candidatus Acidoferrales bacterium]|nr:hypothetical protein [Candidatus Acidoferrales bacterium]
MIAAFRAFAMTLAVLTVHGPVWSATYVAAYQPTFGTQGVPYSGTMKLKFNHGIVSGTYVSEPVRPDPLRNRPPVQVSGGVSHGQITLTLNAPGGFTVRGTLAEDGEISGTATVRGSFYNFLARVKSSP